MVAKGDMAWDGGSGPTEGGGCSVLGFRVYGFRFTILKN